jgi:hypothetical protein
MKPNRREQRFLMSMLMAACLWQAGCSPEGRDGLDPMDGKAGSSASGGKGNTAGTAGQSPDAGPLSQKDPCEGSSPPSEPPRIVRLTAQQYEKVWKALSPTAKMPGNPFTTVTKSTRFTTDSSAGMPELVVDQLMAASETLAKSITTTTKVSFPCLAAATVTSTCWRESIAAVGKKIFRRPLLIQESTDYAAAAETSVALAGGTDSALSMVLEVMLSSPYAVFRPELGAGAEDAQGRTKLGPYETASALSFTLTDGPPTEAMMTAAAQGKLNSTEELRTLAVSLLGTAEGSRTLLKFMQEYIPYSGASLVIKDPTEFAFHKPELLEEDSNQFLVDLLGKHGGFLKGFLTSQESFVDPLTAASYGITAMGKTRAKMPLPAGQRAGLLTQPSFLVSFSGTDSNQPVQRGRFVRERLLCGDVPALPIGMIPPLPDLGPASTLRDRLSQHSKAACRACHELMDPIGLVFEQYDHLGRFRTMESGKPVDTTGYVSIGDTDKTVVSGPIALMDYLAGSATVSTCVMSNLWEFVVGRSPDDQDACVVDRAKQTFEKANQDLNEALISFVTSDAFLYRKSPSAVGVKP